MYYFKKTSEINGFDSKNLYNAKQNNYAWSISEFNEYIYVGTGRNVAYNILQSLNSSLTPPLSITPNSVDNSPEIWRYKKDSSTSWEKVYKISSSFNIWGLRYMTTHTPLNASSAIYAASNGGSKVVIFKSTNGLNWHPLQDNILKGASSRSMLSYKGKLYISTINESNPSNSPQLYSSIDPEYSSWKIVIDTTAPEYNPALNPNGAISNMIVFNDKIYVATSGPLGASIWRTNGSEPKLNDWTLIVDKGFGDFANKYTLSMGIYKDYLYVSGIKHLPSAWLIPFGSDIIRISTNDTWELVVGGNPLNPSTPTKGVRKNSLSHLYSGFNNPFNVYAWQIEEYSNKLLISTFDTSINLKVILDTLIINKDNIKNSIGNTSTIEIIKAYDSIIKILNSINYPFGFDLYESIDGIHFTPIVSNGINDAYNYGSRLLFTDSSNQLYLGTANPFEGCQVFQVKSDRSTLCNPKPQNPYSLHDVQELINCNYQILLKNLPKLLQYLTNS